MIDCRTAALTVNDVLPAMLPDFAEIVVVPTASAVASPVALMVAVEGVLEVHVTEVVRFCVEASLNVPVAVNCSVSPAAIEGFAGVTAIETRVGAPTVKTVEP